MDAKDLTFVIPCKYDGRRMIHRCVSSIRDFYPTSKIIIVDSCSTNRSYIDETKVYNVQIEDIHNQWYIDGALWHAYKKHKSKMYFLLHDSMWLTGSIDKYLNVPFTSYSYWHSYNYSYDCPYQEHYVAEKLAKTRFKYKFGMEFTGLVGMSFIGSMSLLERLDSGGLSKIRCTNKVECCAHERMWGICLSQIGVNLEKSTIRGDTHNIIKDAPVSKEYPDRH